MLWSIVTYIKMEKPIDEKNKQDVMVSNLPLLFSDGKPTSITSMSVEDLQYFVPFLVKCILGCEPSSWTKYSKFKWWPSDVPWSPIILTKKHQTQHWRKKLQVLVKNCYEYNGCTYLLHFSAKLQTLSGGYKFEDNWDGTTSMYDSTSGKLLVTFQNENMNYDKGFRQHSSASRPMLLPRLNSPTSPIKLNACITNPSLAHEAPTAAKMVEPPVTDIYLCDYCGADFSSLSAIKAHEKKCMEEKALEAQARNAFVEVETQDIDQAKFMWYLSLSTGNQMARPANVTPAKIRPVIKRTCTLSDKRFTTIPFSSNLGQSFFKATRLPPTTSEFLVSRYEKFCSAKPVPVRPAVLAAEAPNLSGQAYRLRNVYQKRKEEWTHSYSFSKADRRERLRTIAAGLDRRSRQLLRQCRKVNVNLERLTPEEIEMWTRPKPKVKQPQTLLQSQPFLQQQLQPWLQRSIASLPATCTVSLAPVDSPIAWLRHQKASSPTLLSHSEMARNCAATKPRLAGKSQQSKSPPGLLPLVTNVWSMQTMQSAKPTFILPDVIPVINNRKSFSSDPVIIRMPPVKTTKATAPTPLPPRSRTAEVIDLCSSEDDEEEEKGITIPLLPKPVILPPGISITKVNRPSSDSRCGLNNSRPKGVSHERNNNSSRSISQWLESVGPPPALKLIGQRQLTVKREPMFNGAVSSVLATDASLPIVTPLKLAKLSPEKREQMKQSLLKIQKKEGKSLSETDADSLSITVHCNSEIADPLQLTSALGPRRDGSRLLVDEYKEVKQKGLKKFIVSSEALTLRKRLKEEFYNCDEEDLNGPSKKMPKLDHSSSNRQISLDNASSGDDYSTVIEVDVGGPGSETRDSSRASSIGSLTPDNRHSRKTKELSQLLNDECKELRRNGLEHLSFEAASNQRITRCRTKSLPLTANKR